MFEALHQLADDIQFLKTRIISNCCGLLRDSNGASSTKLLRAGAGQPLMIWQFGRRQRESAMNTSSSAAGWSSFSTVIRRRPRPLSGTTQPV